MNQNKNVRMPDTNSAQHKIQRTQQVLIHPLPKVDTKKAPIIISIAEFARDKATAGIHDPPISVSYNSQRYTTRRHIADNLGLHLR